MIPRPTLLFAVAVMALLGALAAFGDAVVTVWWACAIALLAVSVIDAVAGWQRKPPSIARKVPGAMALQTRSQVTLSIEREPVFGRDQIVIHDHFPESFECDSFPLQLPDISTDDEPTILSYRCTPQIRGSFDFDGVSVRIASPLGLWWRQRRLAINNSVRVYPNYSSVTRSVLKAAANPLLGYGVHLRRQRGEGLEFHELRDYREGDSLRALDWKATSRMGRMISREYRDERDQHLIFVVDGGRRMRAKDGLLSHFDHTLNALLVLAYVALRQGDSVSVMTVGAQRKWFPPCKGVSAINDILGHVFSLEPVAQEVDYVAAATELSLRQRRRGLVVMLTNVRDEDSDDLLRATRLLKHRHLVLLASLRERALDDVIDEPVVDLESALTLSATDQFMDARRKAQALLQANGVFVEDCVCSELAHAITNRYFAIKRAGML